MVFGTLLKVDVRPPSLVQGIDGRGDHSGQVLDRVEFAELGRRQRLLNDPAQLFVVHRSAHSPSHSGGEMFERHDLEAVTPFVSRAESKLAGGHPAVGYDRSSMLDHQVSLGGGSIAPDEQRCLGATAKESPWDAVHTPGLGRSARVSVTGPGS